MHDLVCLLASCKPFLTMTKHVRATLMCNTRTDGSMLASPWRNEMGGRCLLHECLSKMDRRRARHMQVYAQVVLEEQENQCWHCWLSIKSKS